VRRAFRASFSPRAALLPTQQYAACVPFARGTSTVAKAHAIGSRRRLMEATEMTHTQLRFVSRRLFVLLLLCAVLGTKNASAALDSTDHVWTFMQQSTEKAPLPTPSSKNNPTVWPTDYALYTMNDAALRTALASAPEEFSPQAHTRPQMLELPLPEVGYKRFSIVHSPILSPQMAEKIPGVETYAAQGVDEPTWTMRFSRTPMGFQAVIVTPDDFIIVERAPGMPDGVYRSFRKSDVPALPGDMTCLVQEDSGPITIPNAPPSGANLRTYNLAVATTGEYTAFWGGAANAGVQVAVAVNAVDAIYEREVAIRLLLNCTSIATNAGTDGFDDPNTVDDDLLNEADTVLDGACAGYQIGHLFHRRTDGVPGTTSFRGKAQIGSVCGGSAGRAASTITDPSSSLFTVDLVPHEMGHQFNATHSYNSTAGGCTERTASSAWEIGSGSTIMSYALAGCTNEDIPGGADAYFHTGNFDQITNFREGTGNCGGQTSTGNTPPTVEAGGNFTIPRGTPFVLTATGSDPDGDPITFCWEEFDLGAASPPLNGGVSGPLFRSRPAVASASRTFPILSDLIAGNPTPFEILPTANRTLNFRCTVRDNRTVGGVNYDAMVVTVAGDPFFVTAPNGGESLKGGCSMTVTWTVGGGSVASNVDILLSTDGGNTFSTVLAANTANDGTEDVTVPCVSTAQARVEVRAVNNIFFDISNTNFTIQTVGPVVTADATGGVVDATCSFDIPFSATITDDCHLIADSITVVASVLTGNATVGTPSFVVTPVSDTEIGITGTVTVSALTSCPAQVRITVAGEDNCDRRNSDPVTVEVTDNTPPEITVELNRQFLWPPNHRLSPITVGVTVTDNCPVTSFVLTNITSSEAVNGLGDGDTAPDVVGASYNTPDTEFELRAERSGTGPGRVYTISYAASDGCNNSTPATAEVVVAHDQDAHAMAAAGLTDDGTAVDPATEYVVFVVPSEKGEITTEEGATVQVSGAATLTFDARRIETAQVGNAREVVAARRVESMDVTGDGLMDRVVFFAAQDVRTAVSHRTIEDGPLGFHFENGSTTYLLSDIFAPGALAMLASEPILAAFPDQPVTASKSQPVSSPAPRELQAAPALTRLVGGQPNPFTRTTGISFELARPSVVRLELFDASGRRVRMLSDGAWGVGRHSVTWDGRDSHGSLAPTGLYFVRFQGDGVQTTSKVMRMP
jgi:hypothetical protein